MRSGVLGLLLLVCAATGVRAQAEDAYRSRWGGHAGFVSFGTGDDLNCPTGIGFSAGAEARTRGAWLGAIGADVMLASAYVCTSAGLAVRHNGELLDVRRGTDLIGAPRIRVRAGRALRLGRSTVELAAGAGAIYSRTDFPGAGERSWNRWAGGTVAVRIPALPVGLEVEYGRHQVPTRYYRGSEVVHEFRRWTHLVRISAVL